MDIVDLKKKLEERRKSYVERKAANDYLKSERDKFIAKSEQVGKSLDISRAASEFLVSVANQRRSGSRAAIEKAATDALSSIYGDDYSVRLDASQKANRSNLDVVVVRKTPDGVVERGIEGVGGGVADTVSLPLRLMVLAGSDTDKVAVLDECWKHLDVNRIGNVGKLLKNISNGLKMQIIFATHHHGLEKYADRIYEVSEDEGVSKGVDEKIEDFVFGAWLSRTRF